LPLVFAGVVPHALCELCSVWSARFFGKWEKGWRWRTSTSDRVSGPKKLKPGAGVWGGAEGASQGVPLASSTLLDDKLESLALKGVLKNLAPQRLGHVHPSVAIACVHHLSQLSSTRMQSRAAPNTSSQLSILTLRISTGRRRCG
jgi:hypothetical protein